MKDCCARPDVSGRWIYEGGVLSTAFAYCKECGAKWALNADKTALELKRVHDPRDGGEENG